MLRVNSQYITSRYGQSIQLLFDYFSILIHIQWENLFCSNSILGHKIATNLHKPPQHGLDLYTEIKVITFAKISLKISLKFVPKVRINNIPALVQIMASRRPADKPLCWLIYWCRYASLSLNELMSMPIMGGPAECVWFHNLSDRFPLYLLPVQHVVQVSVLTACCKQLTWSHGGDKQIIIIRAQ